MWYDWLSIIQLYIDPLESKWHWMSPYGLNNEQSRYHIYMQVSKTPIGNPRATPLLSFYPLDEVRNRPSCDDCKDPEIMQQNFFVFSSFYVFFFNFAIELLICLEYRFDIPTASLLQNRDLGQAYKHVTASRRYTL